MKRLRWCWRLLRTMWSKRTGEVEEEEEEEEEEDSLLSMLYDAFFVCDWVHFIRS